MKPYLGLALLSLCLIALSACSGTAGTAQAPASEDPSPAPTQTSGIFSTSPTPLVTPATTPTEDPASTTTPTPALAPEAAPATSPASTMSLGPTPTPDTTPVSAVVVATPVISLQDGPLSREEIWVRDRVQAVVSLYGITPEGHKALQGLDVRWMRDQPGWFGSHGYKGWTGVGEARPIGVIHELSHAYWGLFPVTGLPGLGWDDPEGEDISPGLERYNRDVLDFMKQPPDGFELLRRRLRALPKVSASNPGPLFHTIEADAIYITGGDLDLIPPILRKYWDRFLQPGPFYSWYEALGWYQALPAETRRHAGKYIGFEHFDLENYDSLKASETTGLGRGVEGILRREEAQRLRDFVEMFDLLRAYVLGTSERKENFRFWRSYLRDKSRLHEQHPDLVASLDLPRADEIARVLDFLKGLEGTRTEERVGLVVEELGERPFLVHFLPALDDRALLELFTSGAALPEEEALKVTADFVESLEKFTPNVNTVLEAGRQNVSRGAGELTSYLEGVDFQNVQDLRLFFEVLRGSDTATAKRVVSALDDSMLRRLLEAVPTKLRGLLTPTRFLEFMDITPDSSPEELTQGIEDMIKYPSGNFRIERPFLDEMYGVVSNRGKKASLETLNVISAVSFPMERFIRLYPTTAVAILASDLDVASRMIMTSDPVLFPPARFVYRLIYADPEFAAQLAERVGELYGDAHVVETLSHFAYDADRLDAVADLPISLEKDGRFLKTLMMDKGAEWLEERVGEAIRLSRRRVERGEIPEDFLPAYERTLRAATASLEDREARRTLEGVIDRAFR